MNQHNIHKYEFSVKHLTPIRVVRYLEEISNCVYLFETGHSGGNFHSFVGANPTQILRVTNGRVFHEADGEIQELSVEPVEAMNAFAKQYCIQNSDTDNPHVHGGIVGYIGYDFVRYLENIPMPKADLEMDDALLMLFPISVTFEHGQNKVIVTGVSFEGEDSDEIHVAIKKLLQDLQALNEFSEADGFSDASPLTEIDEEELKKCGEVSENTHRENVEKIKEYIRQGDIFQAVYSIRFKVPMLGSSLETYSCLRAISPTPYLFYLKMKDGVLMGASPETLLRYDRRLLETHPIAGTRHRGKDLEEDLLLEKELLSDEKETAEHIMLVDLGRNDLSKVSKIGTVKVDQFMKVQHFSHVMHIVSIVRGEKDDDATPLDALLSCFPAGTLSGAPKIRAMEIISEMERTSRASYGGAILFSGFSGAFDSCITIRSIYARDGIAYIQAGGGIVADSNPRDEYQEILNKAKSTFKAVKMANSLTLKKGESAI